MSSARYDSNGPMLVMAGEANIKWDETSPKLGGIPDMNIKRDETGERAGERPSGSSGPQALVSGGRGRGKDRRSSTSGLSPLVRRSGSNESADRGGTVTERPRSGSREKLRTSGSNTVAFAGMPTPAIPTNKHKLLPRKSHKSFTNPLGASITYTNGLSMIKVGPPERPKQNKQSDSGQKLDAALRADIMHNRIDAIDVSRQEVGDLGTQCLARLLETNKSVTALYLRHSNITRKSASAIAECLSVNTTLKIVDLWANKMKEKGTEILGLLLQQHIGLGMTSLNLSANHIGPRGALALAQGLRVNTSLESLSLEGNKIGDKAARAIAEALAFNQASRMSVLNLSSNLLSQDGLRDFVIVLQGNTSLRSLYIEQASGATRVNGQAPGKSAEQIVIENSILKLLERNKRANVGRPASLGSLGSLGSLTIAETSSTSELPVPPGSHSPNKSNNTTPTNTPPQNSNLLQSLISTRSTSLSPQVAPDKSSIDGDMDDIDIECVRAWCTFAPLVALIAANEGNPLLDDPATQRAVKNIFERAMDLQPFSLQRGDFSFSNFVNPVQQQQQPVPLRVQRRLSGSLQPVNEGCEDGDEELSFVTDDELAITGAAIKATVSRLPRGPSRSADNSPIKPPRPSAPVVRLRTEERMAWHLARSVALLHNSSLCFSSAKKILTTTTKTSNNASNPNSHQKNDPTKPSALDGARKPLIPHSLTCPVLPDP